MDTLRLGHLITEPRERDAVHIAVAPVIAGCGLRPGDRIGFADGSADTVIQTSQPIGIADPFLKWPVEEGQKFWMFLFPGSITSLRHDWTHPAFAPPTVAKPPQEQWLRDFADRHDLAYSAVIQAAREFIETGAYYVQHGSDSARDEMNEPAARERFWSSFEAVTGSNVPDESRQDGIFCCSC